MNDIISLLKWNRVIRYAVAPIVVALVCRAALNPVLHDASPFTYFYAAIIVSGLLGGSGPGLTATGSVLQGGSKETIQIISFLVLGSVISVIAAYMRRERRHDRQAARAARASEVENEKRLRFALETCHIGAWDLNLTDHTAYHSLEHDRIFGYEELLPQWNFEMFLQHALPEYRAQVEAMVCAATAAQSGWCFECRIRRADGNIRWIWVAGSLRIDAASGVCRVAGVVQDITERKEAEESLRESEERFRTMANSLPQLVWIGYPDGFIFWFKQLCYDYTGATPRQLEGWGWQSVVDPSVLPQVMEQWNKSIATGELFELVFPLRRNDGRFCRFLTRVRPLKDEQGRVVQWFGTNTDVDELKRSEDALRESERRLILAQQTARSGSFNWDIQEDINVWTPELKSMYGLKPGEFGGTKAAWVQLVQPEDQQAALELIGFAFDNGHPVEGEWRVQWPDGSVHWIFG